jgi:hypothetical protein
LLAFLAPAPRAVKSANPGDTATTKGLLDDAVVQVGSAHPSPQAGKIPFALTNGTARQISQAFEDQGFPEDHRLSNIKLLLGFVACVLALVAQFWPNPLKPMPFPESRPLLLVCCGTYFAISFGLQAITSFYEKDAILYTLEPVQKSPWYAAMQGHKVKVSTTLPRFSVMNFLLSSSDFRGFDAILLASPPPRLFFASHAPAGWLYFIGVHLDGATHSMAAPPPITKHATANMRIPLPLPLFHSSQLHLYVHELLCN